VRKILNRIAESEPAERGRALAGFLILAGLRELEEVIEREASQMPLLDDIMDHKVLGREFKRGLAQGRLDGELAVLLPLMEKRFGPITPEMREKLAKMSTSDVETVSLRLLDVGSAEELFG